MQMVRMFHVQTATHLQVYVLTVTGQSQLGWLVVQDVLTCIACGWPPVLPVVVLL